MISPSRQIVITGIGAVSPIGIGYEAVASSLAAGQSGMRRLPLFDNGEYPIRIGAEVIDFDPKQYVTPRKSLKVMSRPIQLAFSSAHMATQQSGIAVPEIDPDRFGCVFGADMIHIEADELCSAFQACITDNKFEYARWDERAISEMYPLWMLKYLPNMPACHVAIAQDARGPNNTIVLGEASSLLAIAEGARVIERDQADVMIVGGTGSRIHPLSWCFRDNSLHSPRWEDPAAVPRPFDARRDGLVYGEGAAAFVLERRDHAEARGAKILAQIVGFGNAFEPCVPGEPITGSAIRAAITVCMREARMEPKDLGHVNAHGLSTIYNDRAEAAAIHDTLGDVPVTAPKSFYGNLGAGTGAVELISSLHAFETGVIPPTLNYEQPDPACPVNVVGPAGQPARIHTALVLNQTGSGQSVALALRKPN
jgi:3-oxoacyl-[acyl-carrier-protein] synthase II